MNKVDLLIEMINNDESVLKYKELEEYINNNKDYQILISKLKDLQKKYINNPTLENKKKLEEHRNLVLEDINIARYLEYIEDINDKIQVVIKIINDEIKV